MRHVSEQPKLGSSTFMSLSDEHKRAENGNARYGTVTLAGKECLHRTDVCMSGKKFLK